MNKLLVVDIKKACIDLIPRLHCPFTDQDFEKLTFDYMHEYTTPYLEFYGSSDEDIDPVLLSYIKNIFQSVCINSKIIFIDSTNKDR